MHQKKNYLKPTNTSVAYPTIALTIFAMVAYVTASFLSILGSLGVGWTIAINSVMAYLLFTSMHEAGHQNISGSNRSLKWLDEVIGWISGIPLFAPYYIFRVVHFRHHAYTNDSEKDPDHWLASKNIIALLFHSTTIFPVYMIKGLQLLLSDEKINKKVKRELRIGYAALFAMVLLLVISGLLIGWSMVLQVWILPAFIAQAFLALTFDWLPHHPHEEKSRYLNTRVFDIPGLSILFLGQNYHLIHHLYPRIPFYDYKKVYFEMEDELKQKNVDIISVGNKKKI